MPRATTGSGRMRRRPCDPERVAAPAFESPPLAVTIVAGVQTNIGDVPMEAFPFLFDFSPAQDAERAGTGAVRPDRRRRRDQHPQDSVQLEVSFTVPDERRAAARRSAS